MSPLNDLKTLKELLDAGAITQEEYDSKKASILAEPTTQSQPVEYVNQYQQPVEYEKSKIAAGLFAILLGTLGIHKFYLGYTTQGVIMLLVSLLTFGIGAFVMAIIGLVEGIIYLTKSDSEFNRIYVENQKTWF